LLGLCLALSAVTTPVNARTPEQPSYPSLSVPSADFDAAVRAYHDGNYSLALASAKLAGAAGNSDAQVLAGIILMNGETGLINDKEAADWFSKAASLGNSDAQLSRAAELMKQAAYSGIAGAQADYGLLVYQGAGAKRSERDAAEWFRKSAEGGDKEGQFLYAFTLAKGEGVSQNYEEAYYWLLKSGESGVDDYDNDRRQLRERLEANVDSAILARARQRAAQ